MPPRGDVLIRNVSIVATGFHICRGGFTSLFPATMDRTSGCVCRHRGSCLVPVRVRRWRMTKQAYEYNRPRPSKSRGISSLRNLNLNPAPPRRGCIERNRGRVILFSSLDFSFSFFLLPTLVFSFLFFSFHIEYTHLGEEIIFARVECIDRVDFSDNCGHGGSSVMILFLHLQVLWSK